MNFRPHDVDPALDLVIDRKLPVAPELVWRAWTEPDLLKQFFTPRPWATTECEIELRPGGVFRTVMQSPEGDEFDNSGCYLDIVPNERLVWTSALRAGFRPCPATNAHDLAMTAVIEIRPDGEGTHYRAIAMHADQPTQQRHHEMGFHDGWGTVVDQLVELMQG